METNNTVEFAHFTRFIFDWLREQPVVGILFVLMVMDVISGLLAAFITKTISSSVSARGMTKKVFVWLIVGVGAAIGHVTPDLPLMKLVAGFYVVTEGISILENAAMAGVPVPPVILETLQKLREVNKRDRMADYQGEAKPLVIERVEKHIVEVPAPATAPRDKEERTRANDAPVPVVVVNAPNDPVPTTATAVSGSGDGNA